MSSAGLIHLSIGNTERDRADICAKETTRDSNGCGTAKDNTNALGENHCTSSTDQKRSFFMSTAAAQEEPVKYWRTDSLGEGWRWHSTSPPH